MKQLLIAFSLFFTITSFSQAGVPGSILFPVNPVPAQYSAIVDVQSGHDYLNNFVRGEIIVDRAVSKVTMTLSEGNFCPEGSPCIQILPLSKTFEFPIVETYVDNCGSTITVARIDKRPVDGLLRELKISDHTKMICDIAHLHMTSISYKTVNPWNNETLESFFGATALEDIVQAQNL